MPYNPQNVQLGETGRLLPIQSRGSCSTSGESSTPRCPIFLQRSVNVYCTLSSSGPDYNIMVSTKGRCLQTLCPQSHRPKLLTSLEAHPVISFSTILRRAWTCGEGDAGVETPCVWESVAVVVD
ncbi:hypothetical protein E2C01_041680 [Portunus trituberculatus]|uniref:Uncharacterized protein n=1 Tax=Portunus trituberculatus TaxID=210409 RepID=A0A5B7FRN5_PORTR|nr:hypothetical protein [Portunus trituberculatus]